MKTRLTVGLSLALATLAGPLSGQEIPRDEYLRMLPLSLPRLGLQTDATVTQNLYGDPTAPGYRDVDPVDGIDDQRNRTLMDLAVRFAPYLVQNTTNVPLNFDIYGVDPVRASEEADPIEFCCGVPVPRCRSVRLVGVEPTLGRF